ncbi:MAG: FAD:protein FMN transferase, partial [Phycisphaerae bacterium]
GKARRLPTDAEVASARSASGWDRIELLDGAARKAIDGAGSGLGGIAKGYAIDRAIEAIRTAGCTGGLVDVGGDIRCFGLSPRGGLWRVAVRDPFDARSDAFFGTLELTDLAVCTSGNYERYSEIDGKRYSHIIDPRTGRPVDLAPSVTVVAPAAAVADGWATALSVLGPEGLSLLDPNSGIEAMIVVGGPQDYTVHQTPGFAGLLVSPVPRSPSASERNSRSAGR